MKKKKKKKKKKERKKIKDRPMIKVQKERCDKAICTSLYIYLTFDVRNTLITAQWKLFLDNTLLPTQS